MAIEIRKVDVYMGEIEDRPGSLAAKLRALADAGADLEFVLARRQHTEGGQAGKGLVFVAPIKGSRQSAAAAQAGLAKTDALHSLRLIAPNKAGTGARATRAIADAGVNLRGFSGTALANKAVVYFAFDSDADAKLAAKALKKALSGK
jgi:hypothetical protein